FLDINKFCLFHRWVAKDSTIVNIPNSPGAKNPIAGVFRMALQHLSKQGNSGFTSLNEVINSLFKTINIVLIFQQ
ncbi:MAG: hypothetical protein O9353_03840, partial [Bacteroidia bacterium]|nr:hypothetical protein [Bacteroidia bacterium]